MKLSPGISLLLVLPVILCQRGSRRGRQNAQYEPPLECFYEGNWYAPGADIIKGQTGNWCYLTYCDYSGNIQYCDDYNCPFGSGGGTCGNVFRGNPNRGGRFRGGGGGRGGRRGGRGGRGGGGGREGRRGGGRGTKGAGGMASMVNDLLSKVGGQVAQGWTPDPTPAASSWGGGGTASDAHMVPDTTTKSPVPKKASKAKKKSSNKRGCEYNGRFYNPLDDIFVGQRGNRCYGTYCGWNSEVVHYDEICETATSSPPTSGSGGGGGRGGGGGGRGGGGGGGNFGAGGGGGQFGGGGPNQNFQQQQFRQRQQVTPPTQTTTVPPNSCIHDGYYYFPNEDIVKGPIGNMCYKYYCDASGEIVHWEGPCQQAATAATPPADPGMAGGAMASLFGSGGLSSLGGLFFKKK